MFIHKILHSLFPCVLTAPKQAHQKFSINEAAAHFFWPWGWNVLSLSTKSTLIRGTPLHLSVISRDKESAGFEKLGRNSLDPTHDAQVFFCGTHIFYNSQSSRRYSKAPLFCHARWATCIGRSLHDLCMSSRQLSYMLIFSISFQVPTGDLITCKPTHECID